MEGLSLWFALFKAEVVGSEGVGSRGGYWGLSSVAGRLINTCVFGRAPSTRMNRRSCKVWEAPMSCVLLPVHDRRYAYNMMPNCLIPLIPMPSHDSSRPSLPEASRKVATSSTPLSACHSTAQGLGVDHPRNGRTDANSIRSCGCATGGEHNSPRSPRNVPLPGTRCPPRRCTRAGTGVQ
jgi:hypothetical protein